MLRKIIITLSVLCVLSLVSGSASAASKINQPVKFSLMGWAEFSDNRDSSPTNAVSNWDFYIRPHLSLNYDDKQKTVTFFYAPSFRYRSKASSIQNESVLFHDLGMEIRGDPEQRTAFRFLEYFNYTDDPAVSSGGTTLRRDSSFLQNSVELGMTHLRWREDMFDLRVQHLMRSYTEDTAAEESDLQVVTVGGAYLVRMKTARKPSTLVLALDLLQTSYKKYENVERGFAAATGLIGFERIASKTVRVGGRVGAQLIQYNDEDLGSSAAPAASLAITMSNAPSSRIVMAVDHRTKDSDAFPFSSQEATDLSLSWEYQPERGLGGGLAGIYHFGDYSSEALPVDAASLAMTTEGSDKAYVIQGSLTYRLADNASMSLVQRRENVSSDVRSDFTRNSTTLSFDRRF